MIRIKNIQRAVAILIWCLAFLSTSAWAWPVGGGGSLDDQANDIAVAASGNTYIVGSFQGIAGIGETSLSSQGLRDIFVAKLGRSGTVIWAVSAGGILDEEGLSIAVDASENVYITGYFYGDVSFGGTSLSAYGNGNNKDVFIAKLDHEGTWIWAKRGGGAGDDIGTEIAVIEGNNATLPPTPGSVFLAGEYHCSATFGGDGATVSSANCFDGQKDLFISRLQTDGTWLWSRNRDSALSNVGGSASGFESVSAMAVDDFGKIYMAKLVG